MALTNIWKFTKTVIDWDLIAKSTHNKYQVVSVRKYVDKKGLLADGYILTLMILIDDFDYGFDKSGQPRENNLFQNFDVTVLTRKCNVKKGDIVRLLNYDAEHSYAIGYDLLMRFKDFEVIQQQGGKTNA